MKLEAHILAALKTFGKIAVPGFGEFGFHTSKAQFDAQKNIFLPPATEVSFSADYQNTDETLVHYISANTNQDSAETKLQIDAAVKFWKNAVLQNSELRLEGIGIFHQNDHSLTFKGDRVEDLAPDFYGLEEVKYSEIQKKGTHKSYPNPETQYYKTNHSYWWLLFLAIPLLAIVYFGITRPEILFGNKSKIAENNIPPKTQQTKPADSVKTDSLQVLQKLPRQK